MELPDRIIAYIENHYPIPYGKIVQVAAGKGFTELQVLEALEKVNKHKQIETKTRKEEIWYSIVPVVEPKAPPTYLSWVSRNYPYPPDDWTEPFPEIDLGAMFLRTKEERDAYDAQVKGVPIHMVQSRKYGRKEKGV